MTEKLMAHVSNEAFRSFVKTAMERKATRNKDTITSEEAQNRLANGGRIRVTLDPVLAAELKALPEEIRAEIEPKLADTLLSLQNLGDRVIGAAKSSDKAKRRALKSTVAEAAQDAETWKAYWRPIDPVTGGYIAACIVVCGMVVLYYVVEDCFTPSPPPQPPNAPPAPPPEEVCVEVEVEVEEEVCEEVCEDD